ncbi:sentrin-specific protease 6-like isoform X2 [Centruroides vittatus]|uniref:sentrin-specific protease 6-like isoform X2 n=1 Tax=Centruroides vittatus TaxID=120091 RepID=UPI003510766D
MTDSWKETKLQICTPSVNKSQSSTSFSKLCSHPKLKVEQTLSVVTESNGLNSKTDKVSHVSIASDNEQNLQENQNISSLNYKVIPIECTDKKLKNKPKQLSEIKNGRKWKYANVERRRPLHPEFLDSSLNESETEISNSNLEQSQENTEEVEKFSDCEKSGQFNTDFQNCDSFNVTSSSNIKTCSQPLFKETIVCKRKILSESPLSCIHQKPSAEISISKQEFYGKKFSEQFQVYANGNFNKAPSGCKVFVMANNASRKIRSSKVKHQEPECLTISSDEEEENSSGMEATTNTISISGVNKLEQKDICLPDSTTGVENENLVKEKLLPFESMEEDSNKEEQKSLEKISLKCRSVRIGSFKVQPMSSITSMEVCVNSQDLEFHVPTVINSNELVKVILSTEDIIKVLGHFGQSLPVLYIYTTPSCGSVIRSDLKMNVQTGPFYDPGGEDETQKRITILPEFITSYQKVFFRQVFPGRLLQEIDQKNANEILVRSTPHNMKSSMITSIITRSQASIQISAYSPKKPVIKLLTYPPPPQTGGITITSEDLECLNTGEFLNDVIIDFYLKYLIMEKLSESDKNRTHIFSSFFYPRLTQKVNTRNNSEDDISMTIQAKRHSQVKTWTRHVDIFEKDFIIIPINQNSHWFLAIICFPGLVPEKTITVINSSESPAGEMEPSPSPSPSPSPAPSPSQKFSHVSSPASKNQQNIGYVDDEYQINPRTNEDQENEISMDSESPIPPKCKNIETQEYPEEPLSTSMDFEETGIEKKECSEIEKQPCILMFDSLAGPSRWRIVSTLREYLAVEWYTKKGKQRIFDRDTMRGFTPRVPQQTNYSDCGIYVLQYVESFFKKPLQKFSSPLPSLEDWFTEESIMQKRDELRTLILQLQKEQISGNNEISTDCLASTTAPTSNICLQGEESEQR